jgi:putative chitinase
MLHLKYKTLFDRYAINTPLRIAHFLGQLEHESNLKPVSENLNYSSSGLIRTFRKYFTDLEAIQFQRKPERIANRVYANRMGNGNEASGDGWRYRGRGFIQLTGKSNYVALSRDLQIDFVKNPDLLLQEPNALLSALWFWNRNNLNRLADKDDVRGVTRVINGGFNGLDDRIKKVNKWKQVLK